MKTIETKSQTLIIGGMTEAEVNQYMQDWYDAGGRQWSLPGTGSNALAMNVSVNNTSSM